MHEGEKLEAYAGHACIKETEHAMKKNEKKRKQEQHMHYVIAVLHMSML